MSVGAGIEINTATPVSSGGAHGSATSSAAAHGASQANFRDGWQALLAALGADDTQTDSGLDVPTQGSPAGSGAGTASQGAQGKGKGTVPAQAGATTVAQQKNASAADSSTKAVLPQSAQDPNAELALNQAVVEASTGTKTQIKGGDKSKAEVATAPKIDKSQKSAPQEQTGSVSNASALNQTLVASVSAPVPVPVAPVNAKTQSKSDASKDSSVLTSQLAGTSADPTVLGTLQQASPKQIPVASPNVASTTSDPLDATNLTGASNAPAQAPAPEADKSGLTLHADHDPAPHAADSAVAIGGVHAQVKAEPSTSVADQADTSMRKDLDPRQVASQGTGSIPTPATAMANGTSVPASQATNSVDLSAGNNAAAQSASSAAQAATPPAASATPSATKAGTVRSTSVQGLAQRTASRTQPSADAAIHDAQVNIHPGTIGAQENNPTLLRDAASLGGGNSAAGSGNSQSTNPPTTFSAHDTFNALDGDTGAPNTTWIHAGPRHAEAGYLDPTLGWVGVRADSTNGTLHASLVPGSADAAQTLSGHLEGLNRFLNEQQGTPATVTLSNLNSQQTGQFGGQGMGQGSTPNEGNAHNGAPAQQTLPGVGSWRNAVRDTSTTSTSAVQALNTTSTAQTNGRISVIA